MKKIKHLVLLIALLISAVNFSQVLTGPSCSVAVSIPGSGTTSTIDQQTTNGWLSFTAQSNQVTFKVNNISNGNTFGKITKVNLYGGTCGNLLLISSNSIAVNDPGTIDFNNLNLTAGNIYYLETEKSFNGSQCPSGVCTDNAIFSISFASVVCPLACGWNWGANTPTLTSSANNYFTYSGFEGACFIVKGSGLPPGPTFPNYTNLNQCTVNMCNNRLFVGYSECAGGLGTGVIQNYTIYVFPPSPALAYSVVVSTATTLLTFTATGSYTIAGADGQCSPPPTLPNPTLTPYSPELCSCTQLVVNYLGTPNCNISFSPTPICSGKPFCFYNPSQNPTQFTTSIGVFQPTLVTYPSGCHPGLGAGTYTAKAEVWILDKNGSYVPGCFCRKDVPFTVLPTPQVPDVTAFPAFGCKGESTTLTATSFGATGYTWQPNNSTVNPLITTITGNQIYTVTAGNGSGCTSTNVVSVFTLDCCKNPNAGSITLKNITIIPYNPTSTVIDWFSLAPNGTYVNMQIQAPPNGTITGQYTVDGILTVNSPNLFINAANIYFTEGSYINQNQIMTIDRSYLHACNLMWRGVHSNAQLTVINSIFEDALYGILIFVQNHGGLYLQNNVFNINYDAVYLAGANFATNTSSNPAFYCAGNIFTSKTLPPSIYNNFTAFNQNYVSILTPSLNSYAFQAIKGSTLMNVASNQTAHNGINFISVNHANNVKVGESSSTPSVNTSQRNYFNLLKRGIDAINSRVSVINCMFDRILTGGLGSAGIYHNGGRVQVGSSAANNKDACRFTNCNYGIYSTASGTLTAEYNIYNLCGRANGVEFLTGTSVIKYNNNTLTNCQLDLYSFSNNVNARINFQQNLASGTYTTGSRRHHIFINELSTASSPTYVILGNTLSGKDIGVFMRNTNKSNIVENTISTNILTLLPSIFYSGVELDGVIATWVNDNTITNAKPNINQNTAVVGINSNLTTNNTYACNTINKNGISMMFRGQCPSNIYKNAINDASPPNPCKYGILLDNFGFTGPIGYTTQANPTAYGAGGNKWGDFSYNNGGRDTYCQGGSNGSPIYYNGSNILANPFFPSSNGFATNPPSTPYTKSPTTNPNFWPCGSGIQGVLSPGVPPFFGNSLNFGSNTANAMLIARKGIHSFFKTNSINTNTISGASAFMASCNNNCIGTMFTIDSLASSQNSVDVQTASTLNNNFIASNIVEQTQKDFNSLYCSFKLSGNNLTSTEVSQLTLIAQQCPFTDGASVYQARALLTFFDSTEYVNTCETGANQTASRDAQTIESFNNSQIALRTMVYPNPAKDELFIETEVENTTLIIYSVIGQVILNEKVAGTSSKVNIDKLNNGTYLYKIFDETGELIKSDKLIINK